nr:reverse transcriptase domain-containing protein [Tanacetum cinerariifolium]
MRTRSSSNLIVESFTISKRCNRRRFKQIVEPELRTIVETPVANMVDTCTMSEILQAPTEGYGDAIVILAILAEDFEHKKFDETFSEAWDRFKDLLRKCPHHGFLELHQIDKFYNSFTQSDQDSLNAAAGGNLLNRTARDALTIIENNSKVRTLRNKQAVSKVNTTTSFSSPSLDITALTDIVKELVLMNKANQQASVKAIEETCVTCGGPHPYYECLATDSNTLMLLQLRGPTTKEKKLPLPDLTPTRMTLELATRSIAYPATIAEDVFVQVGKFTFLADFVVVDYDVDPRIPLILRRPFLRTARALVDVHEEELILRDDDEKLIFHADSTLKHPHKHGNELINMINFIDITCKDFFPGVLKFKKSNHPLSGST